MFVKFIKILESFNKGVVLIDDRIEFRNSMVVVQNSVPLMSLVLATRECFTSMEEVDCS